MLGDRHLPKVKYMAKRSRIKAIFLGVTKNSGFLCLAALRGVGAVLAGIFTHALP